MLESKYQASLIKRIKTIFPNAIVIKNDPNYRQGFPDLLILHKNRWAALEVKRSLDAPQQPNQNYWVEQLNSMSFARFICPENEEAVIHDLQQALLAGW